MNLTRFLIESARTSNMMRVMFNNDCKKQIFIMFLASVNAIRLITRKITRSMWWKKPLDVSKINVFAMVYEVSM